MCTEKLNLSFEFKSGYFYKKKTYFYSFVDFKSFNEITVMCLLYYRQYFIAGSFCVLLL